MATYNQLRHVELSAEARASMLSRHPIVAKDYTVLTPMIKATYGLVRERVWTRRTGSFLYARPRTGKTRCAMAIRRLLATEFQDIHIMFLSADKRGSTSDLGFVLDLLSSEELVINKRISYREALLKLLTHIETNLASRAGNHLVLLVDELQLLCEADFRLLLVIHNRLEQKKIAMTTLGFSQPEILHVRTALATSHSFNLIARFLSEPIVFDGCAGRADLEVILEAYDTEKCYPEDTDWAYTRFFYLKHIRQGFVLEGMPKRSGPRLRRPPIRSRTGLFQWNILPGPSSISCLQAARRTQ
ncbi:hypothetical protein Tbd_1316 [Thiobacillus denitrificans ATCC 25259]|uniref:ORC1/DEAH AAA+ ATPase domain-containing protein n=1 Tax=Thiobacillus denitrificans (strain ATCC 25259 / T1) TaxID=292415 RepID=Q3SJ98_THIDA|nr:AAA family ATPase [Thiobacillus denitrificans]AAZ97269.1 hypothetical protein Tbd_1316 [Thiobacillus denitrificans ATCC 25259]